ncbi:hypothetical protein OS493_000002 [Desmophyllum pertusum]|uniref:Uncharacterized protein n=1 Tax=Desmophyllum pertusum TaxID=174260 RepID=A0A9X0DBV3_9CNID|nr:hypothetical protein OS493_000002 [Desmophyllum pertusum]
MHRVTSPTEATVNSLVEVRGGYAILREQRSKLSHCRPNFHFVHRELTGLFQQEMSMKMYHNGEFPHQELQYHRLQWWVAVHDFIIRANTSAVIFAIVNIVIINVIIFCNVFVIQAFS